jgi:hypothetical protein
MDNEYEPTSPISSQSSGSPAPEEIEEIITAVDPRRVAATSGSSNKRRGPPSGAHGTQFSRDAKSRRREDSHGTGSGAFWGGEGKKDREELVDVKLAEQLRRGARGES